jgi:hypothetical protein
MILIRTNHPCLRVGHHIRLDGHVVPKKDIFHYFGSMLQKDGDIDEDISHRIKDNWLKWRQATWDRLAAEHDGCATANIGGTTDVVDDSEPSSDAERSAAKPIDQNRS